MRHLSIASSLVAFMAINSQVGTAAASSMRLGRKPAADDRALPEGQPSGSRPQDSPQSKAVVVRAMSLEDRLGPEWGLGSLEDPKASFVRELEEFACDGGVDFVECDDGMEVVNGVKSTVTTCAKACGVGDDGTGGDCCSGTDACDGFTGKVCKNQACIGIHACHRAKIGLVDMSCIGPASGGHRGACLDFGYESTTTSSIRLRNSCKGWAACWRAVRFTGRINGDIIDSCYGKHSCYGMAQDGTIDGNIMRSCKADYPWTSDSSEERACYLLAGGEDRQVKDNGGFKGGIIDSCNAHHACNQAANRGQITGVLKESCNAPFQCKGFARHPDSVLSRVNGCCNTRDFEFTVPDNPTAQQIASTSDGCYSEWAPEILQSVVHTDTSQNVPAACVAPIPTPGPTSSPTPSNIWTLDLQDTAATLATDAEDDITFTYLIASGRDYEISLREKGCAEDDEIDGALYTVTKSTAVFNSTHQWLNVSYSLVKEALASSPIWNNDTSTIELCQVTGLTTYSGDPTVGNLTVAQLVTELEVLVNSVANFTITTNLTGAVIFNETKEVDAAAAIRAFKCDENFEPNNDKLSPNAELFTCVGSKDDAFTVDTIDTMTITQTGKNPMKVIDGGKIQIPSITSTEPLAEGIIVRSRIPINLFDFEEGKILTIEGAVTMKLADGSSRRLNVELGSVRNLQDGPNEASYTVDVALEAAEESAVDLSNSAAGIAAVGLKGFAIAAFFLLL